MSVSYKVNSAWQCATLNDYGRLLLIFTQSRIPAQGISKPSRLDNSICAISVDDEPETLQTRAEQIKNRRI